MQTVKEFVDGENRMRGIFKQDDIPITDIETIVNILQYKLEPEVLAADGERPVREQNKLEIYYNRCLNELKQAGHKWEFNYETYAYDIIK
jgi:hypothetical protein